MSCQGRAYLQLGQKLLRERLLADQTISPRDSVLGGFALAHRFFGLEMDPMRPVDQVIQDGVGQRGIAEHVTQNSGNLVAISSNPLVCRRCWSASRG